MTRITKTNVTKQLERHLCKFRLEASSESRVGLSVDSGLYKDKNNYYHIFKPDLVVDPGQHKIKR